MKATQGFLLKPFHLFSAKTIQALLVQNHPPIIAAPLVRIGLQGIRLLVDRILCKLQKSTTGLVGQFARFLVSFFSFVFSSTLEG